MYFYNIYVLRMALHQGTLQIFENNVGVSDAVLLEAVTEDAFLDNLEKRFQRQQIYVSLCVVCVLLFSFLLPPSRFSVKDE